MANEALQAYYARDEERERLAQGVGRVEFMRTAEIIQRTLPRRGAVVADIGGGPGRYTDWLIDGGYEVIHRDLVARVHVEHPVIVGLIDEVERTGSIPPAHEGGFNGYAHTPEELREEVQRSQLTVESVASIESVAFALADLDERMDDEDERALLLDTLRAVESVPDLLGVGPHLLVTSRNQETSGRD